MKLSFVLIVALLQCELVSSLPMIEIDDRVEQKTTTEYHDSRFDRKGNPYYYAHIKNSSLILTLYVGFKYKIEIAKDLTDDIRFATTISFGSYSINRDKSYSFLDVPTGIKFRASKSGDSLKFARGITLKHRGTDVDFEYDLDQEFYLKQLAKIQRYKQRDSCPDFKYGVYLAGSDSLVMLNLKHDNAYELQVFDVPLSSGRWRQHNAEIILSDSCLNKELKLIVDNDHLIGSFMPGNLIGTKLYLKEPVKTLSSNQPTSGNRNRAWWISIGLIVLFSLGSWIAIRRKCKTKQTTHHSNNVV